MPANASQERLQELAARLDRVVGNGPPFADVRFEPPYPGRAEDASRGRLVLECIVDVGEDPLGVVFTVLIPGRPAEVSVAPPAAIGPRSGN